MDRLNVMVVEDEAIIAMDIKDHLMDLGYAVPEIAYSGEEAIKKAIETSPDLILMDIMLGKGIDGIEASEQIQKRIDVPIIYLTAYADLKTVSRAKITKPLGYLMKPFEQRELYSAIEIAIYNHNIEKELKESKEKYRRIVETANEGIWVTDRERTITFVNDRALDMLGYTPDEIIGRKKDDFVVTLENQHNDIQKSQNGKARNYEIIIRRRSDEMIYCNVSSAPILDDSKQVTGYLEMFTDITVRKKAEEEIKRYIIELERSNKELQQFAYIASHDLQEPLRMISSYLQLIERLYKGKLDKEADDFINFAVDGADRLQKMIDGLLEYSRVETKGRPFEKTDCNIVIEETLSNLKVAIEESRAVITFDPMPVVMGDTSQLIQVFQNLISNAIKFHSSELPRIHITAENKEREWKFCVRDNGIGIDPKYIDRLFIIFKRLQGREYPGTGIGLAVCKRIVERHGGRIWVESQVGKGSSFFFTIPEKEVKSNAK